MGILLTLGGFILVASILGGMLERNSLKYVDKYRAKYHPDHLD